MPMNQNRPGLAAAELTTFLPINAPSGPHLSRELMRVDSDPVRSHDEMGENPLGSRTIDGKSPSKDWGQTQLARLSV
ncbi:MAG: hypothetical protein ABJJ13_26800 [Rhodopirellula bahusiensis]|uniref:hypothetical protein n=1 Tax=Rhodopirellula bahusiensis TaxID=2014065 RepID=UPI003297702F